MNKGDLIEAVADRLGESKSHAAKLVEAVFESITEGVREEDKVAISVFGTFKKRHRKERSGVNPATREPQVFPATTTVGFTPSQQLKDHLVNH